MAKKNIFSEHERTLLMRIFYLNKQLKRLRNLKKNLESGVIVSISKDLVKCLMEKDWRNG